MHHPEFGLFVEEEEEEEEEANMQTNETNERNERKRNERANERNQTSGSLWPQGSIPQHIPPHADHPMICPKIAKIVYTVLAASTVN